MTLRSRLPWSVLMLCLSGTAVTLSFSQENGAVPSEGIRVTLLGTASGPRAFVDKSGISTLVEAGGERLLFDAGRGFMQRLVQAGFPMNAVTTLFLTHLHSDHIIGVPDLMLTPWSAAPERKVPLEVWGPDGTRDMMRHLEAAFAFDVHMRRDVDERFSPEGIKMVAHDIREGKVYENNGVTVTAFLVSHGLVNPSYGYRVDYGGRSVALSGDTSPSDNLVAACKGVDVLIHEAIDLDVLRRLVPDKARMDAIVARHTTAEQAAGIFSRVSPRLAVFSHSPGTAAIVEQTRRLYSGRVEMGQDLMVIDIGAEVGVKPAVAHVQPGAPAMAPAPPQAGSVATRGELITVASKDGTRIGVECTGAGPTLLFVHGGVGDRTRWTPMFPLLQTRFTVCAMDRRGRGTSGDSADYSLLKEAEDVAAVVNSRPGPVFVFGHSYGGVAALEATFLTDRIAKLMLYEPPLHEPVANNLAVAAKVDELVKKGDLEQAFVVFQTEIVKQSPAELARMKARPTWARLVATIAVHPRQMRALSAYRFDATRMKSVTMPTLLLIGEDTASPYAKQSIGALRESLPNPTVVVLERQEHNAMDGGREVLANAVIKFAATKE